MLHYKGVSPVMYSRMNCFFIYVYYVLYRRYKTYIYIQKSDLFLDTHLFVIEGT